ncbi:MAG: hypothetical protein AMXMBFR56_56450 [Polyangiaceae bacterium]
MPVVPPRCAAAFLSAVTAQARGDHADVQVGHGLAAAARTHELIQQPGHGLAEELLFVPQGEGVVDHQQQIDLVCRLNLRAGASARAAATAARAGTAACRASTR